MKKKKKAQGITALKSRYGRMFTLPWLIGMVLFFIIPLIEAIQFSFSEVTIGADGIQKKFISSNQHSEICSSMLKCFPGPTYLIYCKVIYV